MAIHGQPVGENANRHDMEAHKPWRFAKLIRESSRCKMLLTKVRPLPVICDGEVKRCGSSNLMQASMLQDCMHGFAVPLSAADFKHGVSHEVYLDHKG